MKNKFMNFSHLCNNELASAAQLVINSVAVHRMHFTHLVTIECIQPMNKDGVNERLISSFLYNPLHQLIDSVLEQMILFLNI